MSNKSYSLSRTFALLVRCLGISFLFTLTSCYDDNDPSYEKEVLRLTAENAVLMTRLEISEKEKEKTSNSLSSLRAEIASHKQKNSEAAEKKIKTLEDSLAKRDSQFLKLSEEIKEFKKNANKMQQLATSNATTEQNNSKNQAPTNPREPTQIQRQPTPPIRTSPKLLDPNAHQIDWNKAK